MNTVLLMAVPFIMVENKSPIDALKRSYSLCKDFSSFIFYSQFTFNLIIFGIMVAMDIVWGNIASVPTLIIFSFGLCLPFGSM